MSREAWLFSDRPKEPCLIRCMHNRVQLRFETIYPDLIYLISTTRASLSSARLYGSSEALLPIFA